MPLPRIAFATFLLLLTAAGASGAQQSGATSDSVDAVIAAQIQSQRIPGLSLAVAGFARFVESGLTVIILMNLDDADVESILRGVAGVYLPSEGGQAVRR